MSPQHQPEEDAPRVVIRDKRRIDPVTGEVRTPVGTQPAGVPPGAPGADATTAAPGEQMSEQDTSPTDQPVASSSPDGGAGAGGEVDDLARQLAERTEDLQRVTAEYANYRRRVDRDRQLMVDQAAERFAAQLFPIVDDLERARDHGELTGGFKSVADRILGLLDGLGVQTFGTAGDPFDPSLHEAVMHSTSAEVSEPTATTVLRQGFRRGDRILRHAMVAVTDPEAPAPAEPAATDATADPASD